MTFKLPAAVTSATSAWTTTATKNAAYTAANNEKVPADATAAPFPVTLPAAVVSATGTATRAMVTAVAAPTVTNVVTVTAGGTDSINLPAALLPLTLLPGESIEVQCLVAGKWSVV